MMSDVCCVKKNWGISQFLFRHRLALLIFVMVTGVVSDQVSKYWAQNSLAELVITPNGTFYQPSREIVVVPQAFNLIYRENPAAAFSITRSLPSWFRRPFLVSISLLATIFFVVWYFRLKEADGLQLSSFALIMAGAVGNLIDRVRFGYVVDFLDAHSGFLISWGIAEAHWPTFNIADSCIVVGAIGIIFRTLIPHRDLTPIQ